MAFTISEIGPADWERYAGVSTEYLVKSVLECQLPDGGMGGIVLREKAVESPYSKRFAADDVPATWATLYDIKTWGVFLATDGGRAVGAAAVAPPSPGLVGVEHRQDAAFLFDIRVAAEVRRQGVAKALVECCAQWAKGKGFKFLVIETQNANVGACRLYAACGAELIEIRRLGYAHCPEVAKEAMLIWQLTL
jgi:GNAT superfamily N-acetyltransferase